MSDDDEKRQQPMLAWFQVSLRTLLAIVLGFGLGLAVNYQFGSQHDRLPNPANLRRGDSLAIQWRFRGGEWVSHAPTILADGSIRLKELGGVPAAGMSMDELSEDLRLRYEKYCQNAYGTTAPGLEVFVDASPNPFQR